MCALIGLIGGVQLLVAEFYPPRRRKIEERIIWNI